MADDTAALVVALSAQLSKFERDMKQAGDVADRTVSGIEGRFSKLNPSVNASFLGNFLSTAVTKGISAAEDALRELVKRFEDLQYTAKYTETAIQAVYGLQAAFQKSGSSADDLNKSLSSVALQLDQMQRGNTENPLAKLFAANPQALRGVKVDALDAAEALAKVGDIMQTLKPIERLEVAKALGLPEGAVQALERGGAALKGMADAAAKAAPDLEKIGAQAKALSELFSQLGTSLKNALVSAAFDMIKTDLSDLIQLTALFLGLFKGGPLESFTQETLNKLQELQDKFQKTKEEAEKPPRLRVDKAAPKFTGNDPFGLNAPSNGDAVDRAINQLDKHTEQALADAAATGLGAAALARFRAEALETSAVQANNGKETEAQAAKFKLLQDKAAAAAEAVARAQVNNSISRGQQTALLSPEDVQIANQLKDVYPNVAQALGSVEAAALRTNQALSGVSSEISGDLTNGLTDITTGTKSVSQGFSDMAASIIRDIERMIIKLYIVGPLMRGLQGGFGSSGAAAPTQGAGGLPAVYDGGGYTGPGGKYDPAGIVHKGEVVFSQDDVKRLGGVNVVEMLRRGYADGGVVGMPSISSVAPRSGNNEVTINNYGDNQVTAEKTPSGGTLISIRKMVDQAVGDSMSNGTGRRVLSNQYGVKQFMGS